MDFRLACFTTGKAHYNNTLKLPPTSRTGLLPKTHNILDSATDSNNLSLFDLANDLEIHAALYLSGYQACRRGKLL